MPTKFYRSFIRKNTDVDFPTDPSEFTQQIQEKYVVTGKCLEHRTVSYTGDLIKTTKSVWSSDQAFKDMELDPIWAENTEFLNTYAAAHDINIFTKSE